jgi:hypothetical protein
MRPHITIVSVITQSLLISAAALGFAPSKCAALELPPFDAQRNTWNATHVIVIESGKVVESWAGDLKPGDSLPDGAARFARIPVPDVDPIRKTIAEKLPELHEKLPIVTGKRAILFLVHVPRSDKNTKAPEWIGADFWSRPDDGAHPTAVAWVEAEEVFTVHQPHNPGGYAIGESGRVAALKQLVDVGLALKGQFAAAKAETDLARRADRLAALAPFVSHYAGRVGERDLVEALRACGAPAVKYLAQWADGPWTGYSEPALDVLCGLGPVALETVLKLLDAEVRYWKSVAAKLEPGEKVREPEGDRYSPWRGPRRLLRVLEDVRGMKLSEADRKRIQEHAELREFDKLLTSKPEMKPENSDMVRAHALLRDILAGRFRPAD